MYIKELVKDAKCIGISGHTHPDGDCVGSTLALFQYLKNEFPDKETTLYLEEIPDVFLQLPYAQDINHEVDMNKEFDVYFALDCADAARLGMFEIHFQNAKRTICIDHHKSNQAFADENYIVPDASSTCELVFDCMEKTDITKDIALCLYTGLVHDTGVFQYSCTSAKTMEIAGFLMETGIDYSGIIDSTYYEKTFEQNKILAKAVLDAQRYLNDKVILSTLLTETMQEYGVFSKDLDGIVNQLRITKGVEVAVFIYECGVEEYKISMRSKKTIDVSEIAQIHGGGGHARAAGITMKGNIDEIKKVILSDLEKAFQNA